MLVLGLTAIGAPRGWILLSGGLGLALSAVALLAARRSPPPGGPFVSAEGELSPLDRQSRAVNERLPALVWVMDAHGRTVFQNGRAAAYAGPGARASLVHPDDLPAFRAAAERSPSEFHLELRLRRADGLFRWHHVTSVPFDGADLLPPGSGPSREGSSGKRASREVSWLATALDIEAFKTAGEQQAHLNQVLEERVAEAADRLNAETAVRHRAERQLRHSQKMEAISRLTGGIAHDLNNKLMVISANIDSVVKHIKEQPLLRRKLLAALVASDQASGLMSKLLAFARQRDLHPQYINVAEQLESIVDLLDRSLVSDAVEVHLQVPEDLWAVEVDPHELETAIVNLAVNARDAMAEGGTITIEGRNTRLDLGRQATTGLVGEFVCITVRDTGRGIAPDHLDKVFEPFFTTKEANRASGLGLSQVHGFAEQLGGSVEISSHLGGGTAVSVYLPRAELPARIGAAPVLDDLVDDEEMTPASAEILLVDDEVEVALAVQGMLDELGYATRIAIGADEALEALRKRRPSLVLTDVTMPGTMDGVALGREIRRRQPGLPVVLITGNPTVVAEDTEFPLIQKPFTSRALNTTLQRHLAAPQEPDNVVALFTDKRRSTP
jgi:signal transduction histidine kinase/CheY-like chemotaxis protein